MDMIVGTQQFADVIGKTPKWVNTLTRDGILQQISRGKYDLADNVQRYIKYVQHLSDNTDIDYNEEKALHERAKRKIAELDLAEKELSLIQVDEVVKIMERMVGLFKARCLTIPSKVSPLLQFETEMPVIVGILQKEIKEALQELADHYTNFAEKGTVEPTGAEHEPETS
ncbi:MULTISPECIES: hypothetical protein [Brevibacillus]|uniref:hypothetical protein n=1 Tax=Brevibacillus TaxID=55080 RepID=UPI000D0F80BB|nr:MULTISPECIES: hypothetical protein [Brevibacillus]MED1947055.1 hypothetical protein [Brevibacillus formosus]MED2000469.1 hypothetical protein [Brevibacillus formosus]MED2085742.1 hypothetical protein [Brevibacillus formosus]PSK13497.1 hypothetical protein C7R94_22700 [Brevibacillus sp. NRRL NRS-603]